MLLNYGSPSQRQERSFSWQIKIQIPRFLNSQICSASLIRPRTSTLTPSAASSRACKRGPSPPRRLIRPVAFTTRCHCTPSASGDALNTWPTSRARRGSPAASATFPYVLTNPRGIRRITRRILSSASLGARPWSTEPADFLRLFRMHHSSIARACYPHGADYSGRALRLRPMPASITLADAIVTPISAPIKLLGKYFLRLARIGQISITEIRSRQQRSNDHA